MKSKTFGNWKATNYGIENKKEEYYIEAHRLDNATVPCGGPHWIRHISGKNWAEIENFIKCFIYSIENNKWRIIQKKY